MNSSKHIDISKSSIVGLKAELLKKQEEVKRLKELQQGNIKPEIIQKKKTILEKSNEDVDKRIAKDIDAVEEDYDALQRSREVLEAKARLYNRLKGNSTDELTKSKYLIDFDLKREIDNEEKFDDVQKGANKSENEEDYSDSNSDPENDWVDFVDTLGRSRRCLRKDLPQMKAKDAKLAATIRPPSPPPDTTPAPTPTPELLSWDMQREMMRLKWEEQEAQLLGKKDIHYQDVLFDEARPHGVGYFEFSTDEAERAKQQEELQKLRTQTQQQQEAAQGLRARREQQLQARLAAARRRRRERLGLPPESPPHEIETPAVAEEPKKTGEEESIVDLEESVKKIAPVRPWDIGKNGVAPVMSQEEWIEKKRQERPDEFAPPTSLLQTENIEVNPEQKWKSNPNVFTSKKVKQQLVTSEKSKKHKKSKRKKGKKDKVEEVEEDEEECFGPSVQDWQNITRNDTVLSNETNNITAPQFSTALNSDITSERRSETTSEVSNQAWKPTISDIDRLLSKSRAANFVSTLEEEERDLNSSHDETGLIKPTKQPSVLSKDEFLNISYTNSKQLKKSYNNTSMCSMKVNQESSYTSHASFNEHESSDTVVKPIVNLLEVDSDEEMESSKKSKPNTSKWKSNKRKFAEIAPPPSMSYYIDADKKNIHNSLIKPQLADSISAGISYLKSQTEEKNKKRLKGMLDII
ncbi:coiled-coil domain-containing protein 174 [Macrosteles quadrilineatus]|uniref:coiled-coil domain-containing protein 174 n=1 Tax=Macrosteles quadrilineatus TaxID=74068 RepID=UPI0023E2EB1E|nr:coiled-coil domain-containing protein 174 [Macrosteles quadrilineatus]